MMRPHACDLVVSVGHAALLAICLLSALPSAARAQGVPGKRTALAWPAITRDAKPWTRWWWMGSAVDSATLTRELHELSGAGFGGVEVTAIYGAQGAEPAYVKYLTPEWIALLSHTVSEARQLGMGVDMPPGAGWRTGGARVPASDANASLRLAIDTVQGGTRWQRDLTGRRVEAVVGFSSAGQIVDIARGAAAARPLEWQAPSGVWTVYVADTRFSGDNVKRPAPGGEGFAIDVFSHVASANFLRTYGERIKALPRGAIGSYFHDSFEYTGSGSTELFQFFHRKRGYDLARELPALSGHGDSDRIARVKSDYRQTLDEMLLENFLLPLRTWSHARGSLSRNQAHGSPGNLLDLYAAADIPETEIFGPASDTRSELFVNKFASSAAHLAGLPLASAESFTWLGEHFSATLDEVKQAADGLFLAGINHLIYHGTAYSPSTASWPGWEFYASSEFNSRNAFWRDLPAFNQYVARVQSALQSARPDNDVLLYWPVWDNWHTASGMRIDFQVRNPTWLSDKPVGRVADELWKSGYGFDYLSDRLLAARVTVTGNHLRAGNGRYATLVVPRADHMPPESFRRLVELARRGATIIFLGALPGDVNGLAQLDARRAALAAMQRQLVFAGTDANGVRRATVGRGRIIVGEALEPLLATARVKRETLVDHDGLRFIRQRTASGRQYFISHAGSTAVDGWLPLAVPGASVAIMDPMTGRAGLAETRPTAAGGVEVRLHLEPGGSIVLRTFDARVDAARWRYDRPSGASVAIRGNWSVAFVSGGPVLPAPFRSDSLLPWTGRGDADADRFAGTARYTVQFDAPADADDYVLDLGRVAESARVRVNGRDLGTLIARPFHVVTGPLRPTGNVLEIEVTNLSANRIRDLDVRGVPWKTFHDINYVGFDYKPFDASHWPVRDSGLIGPVMLTPTMNAAPLKP